MKIQPAHYTHISDAIRAARPTFRFSLAEYIARDPRIPNIGKSADPAKRYRWDAMYATGLSQWVSSNVYPYADDTHIDTALRHIVAELEGEQTTGSKS